MDVKNVQHFNPLLRLGQAYRISRFICESTSPYQQTLENKISLRFGKITTFDILLEKESEFPDHHFEFIPYNQLASRVPYKDENSRMIYLILTDYLGCIRSISDIPSIGTTSQSKDCRRKVDIENLEGNIVEFTMWDEMARQFKKSEIERLERPVIIAVSSCRVSKFKDTVKLFQEIRFTCEATITRIREDREWHYTSCNQCNKKVPEQEGVYDCEDHDHLDQPTHRVGAEVQSSRPPPDAKINSRHNRKKNMYSRSISLLAHEQEHLTTKAYVSYNLFVHAGTPPHDVIDVVERTIVTTMRAHKNETTSSEKETSLSEPATRDIKASAKRPLLLQPSPQAKKKKGD
ncbi:nucleic acid-binding, OB-fold protein [Tanacetum coccineum]